MYKEKIDTFIDSHKDEMIETLARLIKIPSVMCKPKENMPFGEGPYRALEEMLTIAKEKGFKTRNVDNYVGTIDFGEGEPDLGILCHLDVVPEGTGWTTPPYELTVKDGKLIGRGTIDDKGPAVAVLYALMAVRESGVKLSKNVRFIVGTNEENGSGDLKYYLKKESMPPMLFTPDGNYPLINIEKGMLRITISAKCNAENSAKKIVGLSGGKTINAVPNEAVAQVTGFSEKEVNDYISASKTTIQFSTECENNVITIKAKGVSAHASTPEKGDNALTGLIELLSSFNFEDSKSFKLISSLSKLFPYNETDGTSSGVKSSDEISGALTLTFSVFDYKDGNATGKIDIRFPICDSMKKVTDKLSESLSKYGFSITDIMGDEPHHVDENSEFVQKLLKVYSDLTGNEAYCQAIGGGTYVHNTPGGVAFGAEFPGEDNHMHGADEFMLIDNFLLNAKIFANAIISICE
jgi:succinyl-diaminopimelate desuccinylase